MSERKLDNNQEGDWECNICEDTGWYGDNGPRQTGNSEYVECGCKNHEDKMSNPNTAEGTKLSEKRYQAEEARKILNKNLDSGNEAVDAMQEYIYQTLDRLKDKVEKEVIDYEDLKRKCNERSSQWTYFDGYQQSMKDVLQLIEEVSDE